MKKIIDYVNVFQGTRASVEPKPNTLSFLWNSFKGKAGNTSPSACLPFGSVSCSPYSGGYSSGYGAFKRNGGEIPKTFFEGDKLIGFSHFTHSGSGAFGFYYNYLVTVPHLEKTDDLFALKEIDNERASVGYYACRFVKENIQAEVTVSDKVAIHRYASLSNKPLKIAVDVSNDGLNQPWDDRVFAFSSESELKVENDCVHGFVTMQGVKIYFCIACKGDATLWFDGNEIADKTLRLTKTDKKFGCSFDASDTVAIVKIGFSLTSEDCACKNAKTACDFDTAR